MGVVPREPLYDSFNPTTLSMVGERARNARAERAAMQASVFKAGLEVAPPLSHSTAPTAPTAAQDTGDYSASGRNTAAEQPTAVTSIPIPQRLALQCSLPGQPCDLPDVTWLAPRLFLAALATTILIFLSLKTIGVHLAGYGMLTVSAATLLLSAVTATIAHRFVWLNVGVAGAVMSRIGWSLPVGLAWFVLLVPMRVDDELCGPLMFSVLVCTALFDWRCLISVHRHSRVSVLAVLSIGLVAAISHLMMSDFTEWTPFAGALAMAAAITVQLVSPAHSLASSDPVIQRTPEKVKKPRLLYDRTSLALELLMAACAMVIAIVVSIGEDEYFGFAAVAAVLAVVAVRFRNSRRIGPEQLTAGTSDQRDGNDRRQKNKDMQGIR